MTSSASQVDGGGEKLSRWSRISRALKTGPMHTRQLSEATGIAYQQLSPLIGRMIWEKLVIVVGTAAQAGLQGVRPDARMLALPGTPKLRSLEAEADEDGQPARQALQSQAGSGQIAGFITIGRGYKWNVSRGPW